MTKVTKLRSQDFVADVRKRLEQGLAKYGDVLEISGNMGASSVFAEIESVKLCVEADLLRDPEAAVVTARVAVPGTYHTLANALLLAAIIEDVARLGLLIEHAYSDVRVFSSNT